MEPQRSPTALDPWWNQSSLYDFDELDFLNDVSTPVSTSFHLPSALQAPSGENTSEPAVVYKPEDLGWNNFLPDRALSASLPINETQPPAFYTASRNLSDQVLPLAAQQEQLDWFGTGVGQNDSNGAETNITGLHEQTPTFTDQELPATNTGYRGLHSAGLPRGRTLATDRPFFPRRRSRYGNAFTYTSTNLSSPQGLASNGLDPMQRWQDSAAANEAVSLPALHGALESLNISLTDSQPARSRRQKSRSQSRRRRSVDAASRSTSVASHDSRMSSESRVSNYSVKSTTSFKSPAPRGTSPGKVMRRSRHNQRKTTTDTARPYKCTFCCADFKHKYDWTRHENSKHLDLEEWKCAPFGGSVLSFSTNRFHCAYCNVLDPTLEHLNTHNHDICHNTIKGIPAFKRKDHLVQHLRLVHGLETLPLIDDWKTEMPAVLSTCGFCKIRMSSWEIRANHLALHFRKGLTMKDWKGDHEFEPEIASRVVNAIPPYFIYAESQTPIPFGVNAHHSQDQYSQILAIMAQAEHRAPPIDNPLQISDEQTKGARADYHVDSHPVSSQAFTDLVVQHLNWYAREQAKLGVIPCDEMLREEARRLCFDSDDPWNQTAADNPEWLMKFRRQNEVYHQQQP